MRKNSAYIVIKKGQFSLTKLNNLLHTVYQTARLDDPYAEQNIYNLHLASNQLDAKIKGFTRLLQIQFLKS
ncbi:hypothetical protein GLP13_14065 [Photobacterium carnosum]|nr:hypothetical protein [Photobacterium carnosum]